MRRASFNIQEAIAAAWNFVWKCKLEQRAKDEAEFKETGREAYRDGATYYVTASDIENQVRQFAVEQLEGKPWGHYGMAWGGPIRTVTIRGGGRLLGNVRDWLLDEARDGRLDAHNFGRGHISGMRYRPKGAPLSRAELDTIKQKEHDRTRVKAVHYLQYGGAYDAGKLLCQPVRKRFWGRYRHRKAHSTRTAEKVTCPRCQKLLPEHLKAEQAKTEQRAAENVANHI